MKYLLILVSGMLAAANLFAAWTVVSEGNNPQVSDGNWVIQLNSKSKAMFVSKSGTSTVLDMSTLNSDLAAAGYDYVCTEIAYNGFYGNTYSQMKTDLTAVKLPNEVTRIGGNAFRECDALESFVGKGVVYIEGCAFYSADAFVSVEFSPDLHTLEGSNNEGVFYQCWKLANIYPSKMNLTSTPGQSVFREIPLTHGLDFSESTFSSIAGNAFYGIAIPNDCKIILPATLKSVGSGAFRQQQNGKTLYVNLRFLGEVPVTLGSDCFTPRNASFHNVLYVDAKKCPSWIAEKFTPLTEDMKSENSYPGEGTLGKTTIGVNQSGWWNWLVQEDLPKGPTEWNVVSENNDGSITIYNTVDTWTFKLIPDGKGEYLIKHISNEIAAGTTVELDLVKIVDDLELPVVGLADEAFKGVTAINTLIIPTGMEYMGEYALQNCTSLTKVVLPAYFDFSKAGKGAFSGCSSLTWLGLSSQTVVDKAPVIPESVTSLSDELFAGCSSITSITAKGVTEVGKYTFSNASSLATITLAGFIGDTIMGEGAFQGTAITASIDFTNNSMTSIPANVFYNCRGVTLVKIPAHVTSIGANAFANIGDGANIDFAGVVPTLGVNCLAPVSDAAGCRYIIRVQDEYKSEWQKTGFTATTDSMKEESDYLGSTYIGLTSIGTTDSQNWMFSLDPSLTWWISGKGTYTGKRENNNAVTFANTTLVTDGTFEMHVFTANNVVYIAPKVCVAGGILDMSTLDVDTGLFPSRFWDKAFHQYADSPAVVKLPDSFTDLGTQAFYKNTVIKEIEFGLGMTSWTGKEHFQDGPLTTAYVRGDERVEGRVVIPGGVTSIPANAFYNCDNILEVIATNVVNVGNSAFYTCGNVTNIVLSADLVSVGGGSGAFYQCVKLKTIYPSEMKLTNLGNDAFRELRLNHGLDFSKSTFTAVTYRSLYAIKCTDADGNACPIILPKTVTSLEEKAFWGQNGNGKQVIVFLGDKPTSISSNALDTDNNGIDTLVVDAEKYPAWVETNFIPVEEISEADIAELKQRLAEIPNFPGSKILGKSTLGTREKYANWIVQLRRSGLYLIIR